MSGSDGLLANPILAQRRDSVNRGNLALKVRGFLVLWGRPSFWPSAVGQGSQPLNDEGVYAYEL
jgi:hypothetical protein